MADQEQEGRNKEERQQSEDELRNVTGPAIPRRPEICPMEWGAAEHYHTKVGDYLGPQPEELVKMAIKWTDIQEQYDKWGGFHQRQEKGQYLDELYPTGDELLAVRNRFENGWRGCLLALAAMAQTKVTPYLASWKKSYRPCYTALAPVRSPTLRKSLFRLPFTHSEPII